MREATQNATEEISNGSGLTTRRVVMVHGSILRNGGPRTTDRTHCRPYLLSCTNWWSIQVVYTYRRVFAIRPGCTHSMTFRFVCFCPHLRSQ